MSRSTDTIFGMAGVVLPFAGAAAPAGWLLCDGSAVSRTTFAHLFTVIGTAYGTGDGSTTFNLPDLRGRVAAGKDNMGGTAAGRLTNAGTGNSGINGTTLGATGGADRHTLTTAQMPAHTHTLKYTTATFTSGAGVMPQTFGSGSTATTDSTGTGDAHPIVQPTIVLNHIIKH